MLPGSVSPVQAGIPLAFLLSLALVWRLDAPRGRWSRRLRSRFVMGVPWGTLVVTGGVVAVYLFVQGGTRHWFDPVTLPFASWSYLYPLGWLLAPFSHNGPGHLIGNVTGTLVLAPLAEYYVGHFPTDRGESTFGSPRTNPWARALVFFPLGVALVGLATSLLAWGPVIGFSGVVFAFAGFALVRYPLATIVALSAQGVVRVVYLSVQNPLLVRSAGPGFSRPWWVGIAVQGHALGLFLGIVAGALLLYRRRERPSALRLWAGTVIVATSLSLWALWWYRGGETYVLYRGLGVLFVVAIAALVAAASRATDRPAPDVPTWGHLAAGLGALAVAARAVWWYNGRAVPAAIRTVDLRIAAVSDLDAILGLVVVALVVVALLGRDRPLFGGVTHRQLAVTLLVLPLVAMAGVAIPVNLTTVSDAGVPGGGPAVEVRGYTVAYAENVPNEKVSVVDVSLFGETTNVRTSGVIVVNEDRKIWTQEVSKGRLAFAGRASVRVGGPDWAATVRVRRRGWTTVGGPTAYQVWLRGPDDDAWRHAFASEPATAGPVLAGKNVSIVPEDGRFRLRVSRNNTTLTTAAIPEPGGNVTVADIRIEREGKKLFASVDGTRVRVAAKETYGGE